MIPIPKYKAKKPIRKCKAAVEQHCKEEEEKKRLSERIKSGYRSFYKGLRGAVFGTYLIDDSIAGKSRFVQIGINRFVHDSVPEEYGYLNLEISEERIFIGRVDRNTKESYGKVMELAMQEALRFWKPGQAIKIVSGGDLKLRSYYQKYGFVFTGREGEIPAEKVPEIKAKYEKKRRYKNNS